MLINKFQCRQGKAKEREEWARRNEGHWRCPFFKYCWEEGSNYQRQKIIQSATGLTIMAAHPKGFALMTEDL
jgi:hypothetical protein